MDVDSDLLHSLAARRCMSPFPVSPAVAAGGPTEVAYCRAAGGVQVAGKDEPLGEVTI